VNRGEWIDGLAVVAAPVLREGPDGEPRLVAALAIAAAAERMRALGPGRIGRRARDAAHRIEARLGVPPRARRRRAS